MKKNYTKSALVSSLALSIALLAVPQANASVFSHLKSIAHAAAKKAATVASDPTVRKAVLGAGAAVGGAFMAKKATGETETPMAAE